MNHSSVDILAIGAHPDDVELNVGGSLLLAKKQGLSTAICHLTRGEMGTRGSVEKRKEEAEAAAVVLDADRLLILDLPDGRIQCDEDSTERVVKVIRNLRPRTILAPYWEDLHPDHAAVGALVKKANFLAGLEKWSPDLDPWRAESLLYYMSHTPIQPTLIVDVSDVFEHKKTAAACYESQFFQEGSEERETFIAGPNFWHWWAGRAAWWGHFIGVTYGEAFYVDGPIPTNNPFNLCRGFGKYKN